MINKIILDLMKSFPRSFINQYGEIIFHEKANEYFILHSCKSELEVKCKVLEWLSRSACNGTPFKTEKKNEEFREFMLNGINNFLGTNFSNEDMTKIYTELGNCVNRSLTEAFIIWDYKMSILNQKRGGVTLKIIEL